MPVVLSSTGVASSCSEKGFRRVSTPNTQIPATTLMRNDLLVAEKLGKGRVRILNMYNRVHTKLTRLTEISYITVSKLVSSFRNAQHLLAS
jgi:hypothetical protein